MATERQLLSHVDHWRDRAEKAERERDAARQALQQREALGFREYAASITPTKYGEQVEAEMPAAFAALDALVARCEQLERERDEARQALNAIHANATSWHGDAEAKQRALNVIAAWALHPKSIPPQVLAGVSAGSEGAPE